MRYFFHTLTDGTRTPDEEGIELPSDEVANEQATEYLAELAADLIPERAARKFGVQVTNEAGDTIAALGFAIEEGPDVVH